MAVELRVHFESYNYLLILLIVRETMLVYKRFNIPNVLVNNFDNINPHKI